MARTADKPETPAAAPVAESESASTPQGAWTTIDSAETRPSQTQAATPATAPEGERIVRRDEAGNVEAEGYMLDGKQHGPWMFYWPDGSPKGEGRFDRGVRTGPWTFWEQGGVKATSGNFTDGKPDGLWEHWHANGVRKAEQRFRDGKLDGLTRTWDEFGRLQQEVTFSADIPLTLSGQPAKHGPYKMYNADGVAVEEGQYDHDIPNGVWIYRFASGQISKAGRYYDGEELGLWLFGKEKEPGYKAKKRLVQGREDIIKRDIEMMEIVFGKDPASWPVRMDGPTELDIRPGQDMYLPDTDEDGAAEESGEG